MPLAASTLYRYRPLLDNDIALLSRELPALLPGDWSEAGLRSLLNSSHQLRVLQAADGDEADSGYSPDKLIVGFAEFLTVVDECQLYNIAVLPRWQRCGCGRRLLQALLDEVKAAGVIGCVLEVRESNAAARALYQALGFVESGKRKAYYPPLPGLPPISEREAAVLYSCLFDDGSSLAS
jgi:ribosomal protein S18 acetylase RimI-like enzyme